MQKTPKKPPSLKKSSSLKKSPTKKAIKPKGFLKNIGSFKSTEIASEFKSSQNNQSMISTSTLKKPQISHGHKLSV